MLLPFMQGVYGVGEVSERYHCIGLVREGYLAGVLPCITRWLLRYRYAMMGWLIMP